MDKPNRSGARYYRVVVPKAGKVRVGKSKPVKVTSDVFRLTYTWKSTVSGSDEPAAGAQPLLAQPQLFCP